MNASLRVLDCTFRDGGYYTDWDFERGVVQAYLQAVDRAGVDFVEIGFRGPASAGRSMGPFAHCPDWFLRDFDLPARARVGVMVNASDLARAGGRSSAAELFRPATESPVSLVRVAAHFAEVPAVAADLERLRSLGYDVGLNLMQAAGRPAREIEQVASAVSAWGTVGVLYFADSLGNMQPADVVGAIEALRRAWPGDLGFHAHDNKGLALVNTLAAVDHGVGWVDATLAGMGRGAGNVHTETLLLELESRPAAGGRFRPEALFPLATGEFETLRARHGWGPNLLYHLAATWSIHPTYVQEMMVECAGRPDRLLAGMQVLRQSASRSFSAANLRTALAGPAREARGSASARAVVGGRDVLLLAPGPQCRAHRTAIERFIRRARPCTIHLNFERQVDPELIDAFATCNVTRVAASREAIEGAGRPVILPLAVLGEDVVRAMRPDGILDYGLAVDPEAFTAGDEGACIPASLVGPYAIAFAIAGGARTIHLAGFDGFPSSDRRQGEMVAILERIREAHPDRRLVSLTPTSYPVETASLYAVEEAS
jgi:4-hydroxy 2-oxovalerate aldolase